MHLVLDIVLLTSKLNPLIKLPESDPIMLGMAASIWTTLMVVTAILLLLGMNKRKKLPPGPRGLPILGHLHMLKAHPEEDLYHLARKYGPIMYIRLGFVPTFVVSSPAAAELFLKTHDSIFADRPHHEASVYLSYGQRNLTFGRYGPYWRNMRKLSSLQLLSNQKIASFQPVRREELMLFIESLKEASKNRAVVDLGDTIMSANADSICLIVFGRKLKDEKEIEKWGFKALVQTALQFAMVGNLGDYFPYIAALDLQGLTRRMKKLSSVFDGLFERIIDEHVKNKDQKTRKDIVDTMLEIMESGNADFEFDRRHVKAIMLDLLLASIDTSAITVEWALTQLLKNPAVMEKLQKELEEVVGLDRMIEESDLEKLEYLDMVIKETLRLHPAAPMLLPREAMQDCTVGGYHIKKGSRIIINAWAIGRDPESWPEPEKFDPERFAGSDIDFRGRHFQYIPFGSGRRICPGMQLALTVVRLTVAQLVHCFNWELPNNMQPCDLDMTTAYRIPSKAQHLMAIPTYRLRK